MPSSGIVKAATGSGVCAAATGAGRGIPMPSSSVQAPVAYVSITGAVIKETTGGGSSTSLTTTATAGETISALRAVLVDNDTAYIVHGGDPAYADRCIGIATTAAAQGQQIEIQLEGLLTDASFSFQAAKPVYVDSLGRLTQAVPTSGYAQIVGYPTDSQTLKIEIQPSLYY